MNLAEIDIYDLDYYLKNGAPHAQFAFLRKEAPVHFHQEPNGKGFWTVTKHDDIVKISRDPMTFSSWRGGTNITDYEEEHLDVIRLLMVNMDPPEHIKYRRLVKTGFTPRIIQQMETYVRESTRNIINNIIERGECDFVTNIAAELPLQVICDMLGIPNADRFKIFDWSNKLIGFDDPEYPSDVNEARDVAQELWTYANEMATEKKEKPTDDITSILMTSMVDGDYLTEMEFDAFFLLLAVAGNETTRNLISGGMVALLENPDQWAKLKSDPDRYLASAVEEMLRWVTPVVHFRRTASKDTEIRGVPIKENDKVVMWYISANRDEEIFSDPYKFDIEREPNDHLSFGIGEHFCLGNSLARLEIRVMFEELAKRLPDLQMTAPFVRLRSNFINGIKKMPVKFTPGKKI